MIANNGEIEDLGVIKEENKTKKWISSKVGLSFFWESKKNANRRGKRGEEEREEEEKRKGMEFAKFCMDFSMEV